MNGIRHIRSPLYRPASNGLAERAFQTFKERLRKFKSGTVSSRLSRFLLGYRITPHSTTGSSLSELMWGQRLRSRLDLVLPDAEQRPQDAQGHQIKRAHDSHSTDRQFQVNDTVYVRNYGVGPQWLSGCVVGLQGLVMYRVRLDNDYVVVRHVDQLRRRVPTPNSLDANGSHTGNSAEMVEPGLTETPQDSSEVTESTVTQVTPPLPEMAESTMGDNEEQTENFSDEIEPGPVPELDSPEQSPHRETASELHRSSRVSHPPVRFGDTVTF